MANVDAVLPRSMKVPTVRASAAAPSTLKLLSTGGDVGVKFSSSQSEMIGGTSGLMSSVSVPSLAISSNLLLISCCTSSELK